MQWSGGPQSPAIGSCALAGPPAGEVLKLFKRSHLSLSPKGSEAIQDGGQ